MSENATDAEISLDRDHHEPQQSTNGQTASNAHEPSAEDQLAAIKIRWEEADNTAENRRALIKALQKLTAETKAPERPGALHPELELSSTNDH